MCTFVSCPGYVFDLFFQSAHSIVRAVFIGIAPTFPLLRKSHVHLRGDSDSWWMMMIAFIAISSGLVPLTEGLCAQI